MVTAHLDRYQLALSKEREARLEFDARASEFGMDPTARAFDRLRKAMLAFQDRVYERRCLESSLRAIAATLDGSQ